MGVLQTIGTGITTLADNVWNGVQTAVTGTVSTIGTVVDTTGQLISTVGTTIGNGVMTVADTVGVGDVIRNGINTVTTFAGNVRDTAVNAYMKARNGLQNIVAYAQENGLWNTIHDLFTNPSGVWNGENNQPGEPQPGVIIQPWMHYRGHLTYYESPYSLTANADMGAVNSVQEAQRTLQGLTRNRIAFGEFTQWAVYDRLAMMYEHAGYDPGMPSTAYQVNGNRKFAGSTTPAYTEQEPLRKYVHETGNGVYKWNQSEQNKSILKRNVAPIGQFEEIPTLSPLAPFTRAPSPKVAQYANYYAYNRTHLPIADLEWRKGFRHIFITRPECYICAIGNQLSTQCYNDEIFYTSWSRMPHISMLLSPNYVTCVNSNDPRFRDNFNYLLSNRVMGLSSPGFNLEQVNTQKSTRGSTVMPGSYVKDQGGHNMSLEFRDTKNLEVFECLRIWMKYIEFVYSGRFASSYNRYEPTNTYQYTTNSSHNYDQDSRRIRLGGTDMRKYLHPYDRALDYCATIFDIVTNETGTKILYWCKYVGVYPINCTPTALSTSSNEAITNEMKFSTTFYYQAKIEMQNKSLVEFNYNAGLVNELGQPYNSVMGISMPFLLRDDYVPNVSMTNINTNYVGAAGMFTGRPYIVLNAEHNPIANRTAYIPQLRFASLNTDYISNLMNNDITMTLHETSTVREPRVAIRESKDITYYGEEQNLENTNVTYQTAELNNRTGATQYDRYVEEQNHLNRIRQR